MRLASNLFWAYAALFLIHVASAQKNEEHQDLKNDLMNEDIFSFKNLLIGRTDFSDFSMSMPTEPPTPAPTPAPTCDVKVEIECTDIDGKDCKKIVAPDPQCASDDINTISFTYLGTKCEDSATAQDFKCDDFESGPSERALVKCFDDSGNTIFSEVVSEGDIISVLNSDSGSLSKKLTCDVNDVSQGTRRQSVEIDTFDLALKDIYGSLQLESCDEKQCIIPATFTYTIENIGETTMEITVLKRTWKYTQLINGEEVKVNDPRDLLKNVKDRSVKSRESTTADEIGTYDVCTIGDYKMTVNVEADPPGKKFPCLADDEYEFETTVGCSVDVDITCVDEEGTDCAERALETPPLQCDDGENINVVTFTYIGGGCDQSSNTQDIPSVIECEDFNGAPDETNESRIICVDESPDGGTFITKLFDETVTVGEQFTVKGTAGSTLGDSIFCEIKQNNFRRQELKINTSGKEDLYLKDVFGSFKLESCDEKDCLVPITYTYSITNVGQGPMDITEVMRSRGDNTVDLLDEVGKKTLEFKESTTLEDKDIIDVCVKDEIEIIKFSAKADPPNGKICFDSEQYIIVVDPNECRVDVEITCEDKEGRDCNEIPSPNLKCSESPEDLTFTYIGGDCDQSFNSQQDKCEDFGVVPSTRSRVTCKDDDGEVFDSETVTIGDKLTIPNSSNTLRGVLVCDIFETRNNEKIQTLNIDTTSLSLKDVFGSLRLESCDDESCLVSITYTYDIKNIGLNEMDVTELVRERGGKSRNLIGIVQDTSLDVGESTFAEEFEDLDVCVTSEITTTIRGEADPPADKPCFDDDLYVLTIGAIPTRPPTDPPSASPSDPPSPSPSDPPSPSPSDPPSPSPSDPPSPSPSDPPSPSPSDPPSPSPSERGQCEVRVEITCVDEDGTNCKDFRTPEKQCTSTDEISFKYTGEDCDQSFNSQDDRCEDIGSLSESASIECVDSNSNPLSDRSVVVDERVTVPLGNTAATDLITCNIFNSDNILVQKLTIDTTKLSLTDKFGSLQLESCDEQSCRVPITYTYEIRNAGDTPMDITLVTRTRGTSTNNLIGLVDKRNLVPGESTEVEENDEFDICVDVDEKTDVRAEADPPQPGDACFNDESYRFTIMAPPTSPPTDPPSPSPSDAPSEPPTVREQCEVKVDITCEDENGRNCNDFSTEKQCTSTDEIDFEYTAEDCNQSFNSQDSQDDECRDFGSGPSRNAKIECLDSDSNVLFARTVDVGDRVTIPRRNAPATDLITCNIDSVGNAVQQTLIIDTGMLSLKDTFGSLRLESCDEQSCLVPVTYTYEISNVGDTPMAITLVTRTRGTSTANLIGLLEETDLDAGESTVVRETDENDICFDVVEETTVKAEADPPQPGDTCSDEEIYQFTITPPPTSPPTENPDKCAVGVSVECTPRGEVEDCGSIVVARTRCNERPLAMVFKYNGGTCDQSDNIQPPTLFQCFDFNGGPPTTPGEQSYIRVTDIKGGSIIYHEDFVAVGDDYTVEDQPFEVDANMNVSIYRNSGDNGFGEGLLQSLVYHSSCSQNLFLKDRYGASQLVIFVNNLQGVQSCFFNATYTISLDNSVNNVGSPVPAILETLLGDIEVGNENIQFDFSDQIRGTELAAETEYNGPPLRVDVVIDLTVVTSNQVTAFVQARSPKDFVCSDLDSLNFVSGLAPPPNIPTRSPTSAPSRSPAPTPDPEITACELTPDIGCQVLNGGGLLNCQNIAPPLNTECTSGLDISEIDFMYRGGGCTNNVLNCVGEDVDSDEVWINIVSTAGNILWNQITLKDTFMNLRGIDDQMEVTIYEIENNRRGEELLKYGILTSCTDTAGLRLKNSYGILELVEFTTRDGGGVFVANAAFADVLITYDVELSFGSSIKAQITSATSNGGLASAPDSVNYSPPTDPIGSRSRYVFGRESYVIDLIDGDNDRAYAFDLEVFATSASNSNLPCDAAVTFEFDAN